MPIRVRVSRFIASCTDYFRQAHGILLYVLLIGIIGVALTVASVNVLDRRTIERTAAEYRHEEFLRATAWVSQEVSKAGGIDNIAKLEEMFQNIFNIRTSIRRLEAFEFTSDIPKVILDSHPERVSQALTREERAEILAGRPVAHFDDSSLDRVWVITAPLTEGRQIIGALRGRFSILKFDYMILRQYEIAMLVASAAAVLLCVAFVFLIRFQVHRPIARLLEVMRSTSAGALSVEAPPDRTVGYSRARVSIQSNGESDSRGRW